MVFGRLLLYTSLKQVPRLEDFSSSRETYLEETPAMSRRDPTRRRAPQGGAPRPPRRPALLALAAAVLAFTTACGERAVTSVPTETDAIEILDVLGQSGLDASKRETGEGETRRWEIVVDEGMFGGGQAALAVQVLRDHGLPRPEEPAGEDGGLIPSERAEKLREQRRLRTDIERQLRALPGVTLALVTIVMPQDSTIELDPYPATASVVINYKDQKPSFTEEQIQNLVARGVPDLKPQDVSVTLSPQTLRPVPQRELSARRRTNILLAVGVGVVVVLGSLLIVLLMQTRRQRAELAELHRDAVGPAGDADEGIDDELSDDGGAAEEGVKRLDGAASAGGGLLR